MAAAEWIAKDIRRVVAPNPSPLTFRGTNSYILGRGRVALVDPGPALPAHRAALLAALEPGETIGCILVTHAHRDHTPLAAVLGAETGAPVLAGGTATDGRSPAMQALAEQGLGGGGEGLDLDFRPDRVLAHGERVEGEGWQVRAIATPGHLGAHLCFAAGAIVFSGDHVMGWASTVVSPPDGDMGAYMASLDRLAAEDAARLLPGHGDPVENPAARIAELAAHRRAREAAILAALDSTPRDAAALARAIYTDTPPALLPAATRNVLAHLIDLHQRNLARTEDPSGTAARFVRV